MYTYEQRMVAVKLYIKYYHKAAAVIRELGYPNRHVFVQWFKDMLGYPGKTTFKQFKQWLNEAFPNRTKHCVSGGAMVEYPQEKKEQAVIDLCARNGSAIEVAQRHGVSRVTLYQWKKQLLCQEPCVTMSKKTTTPKSINAERTDLTVEELQSERSMLEKQVDDLKKAVYRLQLERDVLEKAAEILK